MCVTLVVLVVVVGSCPTRPCLDDDVHQCRFGHVMQLLLKTAFDHRNLIISRQ